MKDIMNKKTRKVIFISFFFPPLGGAGCQRPMKFVKYLPAFGWRATVLTSNSVDYHNIDHSLMDEIRIVPFELVRTGIFELKMVYEWMYKFRLSSLSHKVRNWELKFDLPDRRIGWLPKAYSEGLKIIQREKPDAIFSTSAPFTSHLIGLLLKKKTGLPWVADFRDEWTDTPYFEYGAFSKSVNLFLEKQVLKNADCVVSVNHEITRLLSAKRPVREKSKFVTIPNGFDEDDVQRAIAGRTESNGTFIFTHVGSFYASRKPDVFLKVLAELLDQRKLDRKKVEVRFVGSPANAELVADLNLRDCVNNAIGFVPHATAMRCLAESSALLLIVRDTGAKQVTTGKLFEYLALGKPILGIGSKGTDGGDIIERTNTGVNLAADDRIGISSAILNLYSDWKNGRSRFQPNAAEINKYSRRNIARTLSLKLDALLRVKNS